jgi:peroxiredoxin
VPRIALLAYTRGVLKRMPGAWFILRRIEAEAGEMSLRDRLDEQWQRTRQRSPEVGRAYDVLVQTLAASGLTETSLKPGARMPDFDLPNVEGRFVASQALLERGPLVVSFFRGGWCPFCTTELTALQQAVPEIAARGATLVAITPDTGAALASAKRDNALRYEVLSDLDLGVALQFGLAYRVPDRIRELYRRIDLDLGARHGSAHDDVWLLPIPATYIVDRRGIVRFAEVDCDFRRRMEPAAIIRALDELAAAGRSGGDGKVVREIARPGEPDEGVERG